MTALWEEQHTLRHNDFDAAGNLKLSAVLDLFQTAATEQAKAMGIGMDAMLRQGQIWVMVRAQYRCLSVPAMHSRVTVQTWPLKPARLGCQREFVLLDTDGNECILGSTDWVFADAKTRKLTAARDIYPTDIDLPTRRVFDEKAHRLSMGDRADTTLTLTPTCFDFDGNGHVNNTRYADYAFSALQRDTLPPWETYAIDFHREVRAGERLTVTTQTDGARTLVRGVGDDGTLRFVSELGWGGAQT